MEVRNRPEQIEERRCRDILRIVGTGSIVFSLWTIVKAVSMTVINKEQYLPDLIEAVEETGEVWQDGYYYILIAAVFVALLTEFVLRGLAGIAAISESKGKKRSPLYIVLTFFLIWNSFTTIIGLIQGGDSGAFDYRGSNSSWSYIVIEVTSMIMLIEMAAAGIRLRRLRRRERRSQDAA